MNIPLKILNLPSNKNTQSLLSGSAIGFILRNLGIALLFLQDTAFARWLGPEGYGVFSFTRSLFVSVATLALLGLDTGSIKFASIYRSEGKFAHLRGLLLGTQGLVLATGIISVFCFFIYQHFFSGGTRGYLFNSLLAGVWLVPIIAQSKLRQGFLRGVEKVGFAFIPEEVVIPTAAILFCWLFRSYSELTPETSVWSYVGACGLSWIAGVFLLQMCLPKGQGKQTQFEWRVWLSVSVPMVLSSFTQQLLGQMEMLMLGKLATMTDVGLYGVANRICILSRIPINVVGLAISPIIARLYAQGSKDELKKVVQMGAFAGFAGSVALSLPILLWPGFVLGFFGPGFQSVKTCLFLLIFGNIVHSFFGNNGQLLMMTGNQYFVFMVSAVATLVDFSLNLFLIPQWGVVGAAISSALGLIFRNCALEYACIKRVGISACAHGLIHSLVRLKRSKR